jgi:hypothetical protein
MVMDFVLVSNQNEDILASKFDQILIKISNTNMSFIKKENISFENKINEYLLVHNDKDYVDQEMKIYKDKVHVEINE